MPTLSRVYMSTIGIIPPCQLSWYCLIADMSAPQNICVNDGTYAGKCSRWNIFANCTLLAKIKIENKDMGVVASKRHVESIMASLYHYFKRDSAVPSPHGALSSSVPSSAIDSCPTTVIEELIIATE